MTHHDPTDRDTADRRTDDRHLAEYDRLRPRLFGIAYRMTGSVADAEDLCQEAWLRWSTIDLDRVQSTDAFLVSTVTRLSIDRLRSASVRRETYVGPYLPEPLVVDPGPATGAVAGAAPFADPAEATELADSLTFAFLVLLDELSPTERAVFLLHDVFGVPFDEVADAVDRTPDAARQIASRTRRKLDAERVEVRRAPSEHVQAVLAGLLTAMAAGDVDAVMGYLAPDVVELSDGGAHRRAGRHPIVGRERVARLWVNLAKRVGPGFGFRPVEVNGLPGLLFTEHGEPDMVLVPEFAPDGLIRRLFLQLNPDKLTHLH